MKGTYAMIAMSENTNQNLDIAGESSEPKKKKRKNSKAKGARGERKLRDKLREAGFLKSHRGQQFQGTPDSPDVNCPELPTLHFECKVGEQIPSWPYNAMFQAIKDAGTKIPVVCMQKDFHEWLVCMRWEDWVNMVKEAGLATLIFCPDCKSPDISPNGKDEKSQQKYLCNNTACERVSFRV
jgi:hypothetical protein